MRRGRTKKEGDEVGRSVRFRDTGGRAVVLQRFASKEWIWGGVGVEWKKRKYLLLFW